MRTILAAVLLAFAAPTLAQEAPWPTSGWARSSPTAQGLDRAPLAALHEGIEAGTYGYIDRLVVVKNGYLVVSERYDNDYREISRGRSSPIGCGTDACASASQVHQFNYLHPDFHPWHDGRDVHTLQSVTKSVTATLIGIAIGRGEIGGVDEPVLAFLREYDLSGVDPRLHDATLADLLTMRLGIEWHEADRPPDSTNTTFQLEAQQDWVRFTLAQPMDAAPGEKWAYNSGASHLMSAIVKQATGTYVTDYAQTHLFGPLGIRDYHWKRTPSGLPDTEGGLYLEAEQLAKIGYLYLRDGMWDGRRILPEGWVEAATARHVERVNPAGWGYGFQWWRLDRSGVEVWAGLGFGGQFLLILPEHDLLGLVNSWNLFGGTQTGILGPFIDALIASAR